MENLEELMPFLQIGARLDLKAVATQAVLAMTASSESLELIIKSPQILINLLMLLYDSNETISKDAILALINITANEKGASALINLKIRLDKMQSLLKCPENIVKTCFRFIIDPESPLADSACMILCNLSRQSNLVERFIEVLLDSDITLDQIVSVFTKKGYNKKKCNLHYLGPMFSNLSQSPRIRYYILDKNKCVIQRLLPFTEFDESFIRRGGIVATLKNCCFDETYHSWLLSEFVDILPRLLLPLAGNEQFDDEDNDKLPPELQYLDSDKKRECDPDIRCMLLEAITQLCATKECRTIIRDKNTYIILRELHKWEKDKKVLLACENLVDILIRSEDEINVENLNTLEVPEDLQEKFKKMDLELLK